MIFFLYKNNNSCYYEMQKSLRGIFLAATEVVISKNSRRGGKGIVIEKQVTLTNAVGLHARPASIFIREAIKFVSDIFVEKENKLYNAKSIMSILSMSASKGDTIVIRAEGEDAEEAVAALVDLVENHLSEY